MQKKENIGEVRKKTQKMEMKLYIVKKLSLKNKQNSDARKHSMMKENNIENTAYY